MPRKSSSRRTSILSRLSRKSLPRVRLAGTVETAADRKQRRQGVLARLDDLIARYDEMLDAVRRSSDEQAARASARRKP